MKRLGKPGHDLSRRITSQEALSAGLSRGTIIAAFEDYIFFWSGTVAVSPVSPQGEIVDVGEARRRLERFWSKR